MEALSLYNQIADQFSNTPDWLQYRLALALELAGRLDEAVRQFEFAANHCEDSRYFAPCRIGEARVWLRLGKPAKAATILAELVLISGKSDVVSPQATGYLTHLLGIALARCSSPKHDSMLDPDALAHPVIVLDVSTELLWPEKLRTNQDRAAESTANTRSMQEFQHVGPGPLQFVVSYRALATPAYSIWSNVAERTGIKINWSERAEEIARSEVLNVEVRHLSLRPFLTALANRNGLFWRCQDEQLTLRSKAELPAEAKSKSELAHARDLLHESTLSYPDHYLCEVSLLEAAIADTYLGDRLEATAVFERFSKRYPSSPNRDVAYFNLAKLELQQAEPAIAIDNFYRVADVEPSSPLAAPSYVLAGAALLEAGKIEKAIFPLSRAAALADDNTCASYAAAKLALAYLLADKPSAANHVLRTYRDFIVASPARRYAAFLDSLALYRAAPAPSRRPYHRSRLLSALVGLESDCDTFGTPERVLMVEAYEQLGLLEKAARLAKATLECKPADTYCARLILPIVRYYRLLGNLDDATRLLKDMSGTLEPAVRDRVLLQLAQLALHTGRWQQSIALCLQVVASSDPSVRTSALKLLGRTFEQVGEYRLAALCYAGRLRELHKMLDMQRNIPTFTNTRLQRATSNAPASISALIWPKSTSSETVSSTVKK